jgi:hypothetical protein
MVVVTVQFKQLERPLLVPGGCTVPPCFAVGTPVMVEADRGEDLGTITAVLGPIYNNNGGTSSGNSGTAEDEEVSKVVAAAGLRSLEAAWSLKKVLRKASVEDQWRVRGLREEEVGVLAVCKAKVSEQKGWRSCHKVIPERVIN